MFDMLIAKLLKRMNIKLIKYNKYIQIINIHENFEKIIKIVNSIPSDKVELHTNMIKESKSQFG